MFKLNKTKRKGDILPLGIIEIDFYKIRVTESFKETLPSAEKVYRKYKAFKENGDFLDIITINRNGILVDGYITYMLSRMLGYEKVFVKVVNK